MSRSRFLLVMLIPLSVTAAFAVPFEASVNSFPCLQTYDSQTPFSEVLGCTTSGDGPYQNGVETAKFDVGDNHLVDTIYDTGSANAEFDSNDDLEGLKLLGPPNATLSVGGFLYGALGDYSYTDPATTNLIN